MPDQLIRESGYMIPDGYAPVALLSSQQQAPLRLCVLVRKTPEPVGDYLVVLRDTSDAQVLLGCVVDFAGKVQRWVEIWVQTIAGLAQNAAAAEGALNNTLLDQRWMARFKAFASVNPDQLIRTGWENDNSAATFIDLTKLETVCPLEATTQRPWRLCKDDALLKRMQLQPYSTSISRYLYVPELGEKSPFISCSGENTPAGTAIQPLTTITQGRRDLVGLNLGGLMMFRSYVPYDLENLVDLLGGAPMRSLTHGRTTLNLGIPLPAEVSSNGSTSNGHGWLFLGRHGRAGRLAETFHLKLRLFADAVAAVQAMVLACKQPLLNLSAESFRIELSGRAGMGLPQLWTTTTVLVNPADSIEFGIPGSEVRYFLPVRRNPTVYQPLIVGQPISGRADVRISKTAITGQVVVLEGVFETQERVAAAANDLVRLWFNIGGERIQMFARLDATKAMVPGQWWFSTLQQTMPTAAAASLSKAEGITLPDTRFELLPLLSTPVDLFSLAVLGIRIFLRNAQNTLPTVLSETLSLARQVARDLEEAKASQKTSPVPPVKPLATRIIAIVQRDPRWLTALGPHRLVHEQIDPREALDAIPAELWWEVIATIIRMLPGVGGDSLCKDFGHAPPTALHKIFDPVITDLNAQLTRTRSLILIDWKYNREIHAVIRSRLTGSV